MLCARMKSLRKDEIATEWQTQLSACVLPYAIPRQTLAVSVRGRGWFTGCSQVRDPTGDEVLVRLFACLRLLD